mmetsp:Transcript_30001/g.73856  ORF Transcript_30001/g.73856 Transcript_30001/m.73856 type:complete len:465 (+) Transcript_30001:105-1499(+)
MRERLRLAHILLATVGAVSVMLFAPWLWASSTFFAAAVYLSPAATCAPAHIDELLARVRALSPPTRQLALGIYRVSSRQSAMSLPETFKPTMLRWTAREGQSEADALGAAQVQTAFVITDVVHGQSCHINPLRSCKPVAFKRDGTSSAYAEIASSQGAEKCDFCAPTQKTSEELWGRIHGKTSVTAANAFKADGAHGLLVFERHDPLSVTRSELEDGLEVIERWLRAAAAESARVRVETDRPDEPAGRTWYPVVWWNALHRSSASQIHSHAQMLLSPLPPGRTLLHANAHAQYAAAKRAAGGGEGSYWDDLVRVHTELPLGVRVGSGHVLASLTPHVPAGEITIVGDAGASLPQLAAPLHVALRALIEERGCRSFSLVLALPPLHLETDGRTVKAWPPKGARVTASLLDRGSDLDARTADVGGVDLVLGSVIANTDPFQIAEAIARASGQALSRQPGACVPGGT